MTRDPRSNNANVVPTALFFESSPTAISAIAANLCPACTTKPNKFINVALGSLNGNIIN